MSSSDLTITSSGSSSWIPDHWPWYGSALMSPASNTWCAFDGKALMIIPSTGAPVAATTMPRFSEPKRPFRTRAPPAWKTSVGLKNVKRFPFAQSSTTGSHLFWDYTLARRCSTGHSVSSKRQRGSFSHCFAIPSARSATRTPSGALCWRKGRLQLFPCDGFGHPAWCDATFHFQSF